MSYSITNFPPKNTSGIYAIVNKANGNRYVGSSWNIATRLKKHVALLLVGKHHSRHLQHAWDLYGPDKFDFQVLFCCERSDLLVYEQQYIDSLKPEYNVCVTAGSKAGTPRSDETKAKLRAANLGKKQSEETKKKRGDALRGITRSEEFKKKVSESHSGVPKGPHTEEAKQRISSAQKGRPLSEKNKQGIATAMTGNQNTLGKHWKWKKNASHE